MLTNYMTNPEMTNPAVIRALQQVKSYLFLKKSYLTFFCFRFKKAMKLCDVKLHVCSRVLALVWAAICSK